MKNMYDIFEGNDLKIAQKIQQRRLQMLVHSCIYYKFNQNLISDTTWSKWAFELKVLQNTYPSIALAVPYGMYFKNWDGSTGMDLPLDEDWVVGRALYLMRLNGLEVAR